MIHPRSRLLLISSSVAYGSGYLDHAESEIRDLLGTGRRVLFLPYALYDRDGYAAKARQRFEMMGYDLHSIHHAPNPVQAVESAEAIFIGGGNTFRLLKELHDHYLVSLIRGMVEEGLPYIGSSAGSVVSCPTIRTTNDMPIVEPPTMSSLNLVPFQINPHYLDADPNSKHMGETREERLVQFLEENSGPVVGLREGAVLRVEKCSVTLKGAVGARIFRRGQAAVEVVPVAALDEFLVSRRGHGTERIILRQDHWIKGIVRQERIPGYCLGCN